MEIGGNIALVIVGLAILLIAGDLLVRGAVGLAMALRVPALLVSLTIVAFGTSAPEMVVSINAVLSGSAGIALGNIVGSNIANILLVLGAPALIYPMSANVTGLRRHAVVMLAATALFAGIAYTYGAIDLTTGAILFFGIVAYLLYMGFEAMRGADDPTRDDVAEYVNDKGLSPQIFMFLIAGLIGLPLGAHLLVSNGAQLASRLGVGEEFIGLTIVAFGTSLPELATVMAAALQKKSDVAFGNIIGSNIFNLLAVGGAAGLTGTAVFERSSLQIDLPVMIAAALIAGFFVFTRRNVGWLSGLLMTAGYIGFIGFAVAKAF